MNLGTSVFAQLMSYIDHNEFHRLTRRHLPGRRRLPFSCWEQFLVMAFAQLTYRESLRDIEACLRSRAGSLYHAGLRSTISRSTLAHANEHRPWQLYRALALSLIARARTLYRDERLAVDLDAVLYAIDATTIELCLKLFPWARPANHLKTAAGVKLHTLFDLQSNLPVFARISEANVNEVHFLDELLFEAGAFYIVDRGYMSLTRLKAIDSSGAFFVIRGKRRLRVRALASGACDTAWGVKADQTVRFTVPLSHERYPDQLRRIRYYDQDQGRSFVVLTNNFDLDALTIALLYHARWKIELFFKWLKQHLRIKAFYGTSFNAVATQIWIALAVYALVAIVKKDLRLDASLYTILQILSVNLFEKEPINQVLLARQGAFAADADPNQLSLFNL